MTPEQLKKLLQLSKDACQHSYSPYSKFHVGAAVLDKGGKFYTGCNVENVAYSPTICAERTALVKAISEGVKEFEAIAVYSDTIKGDNYITPCGVCRQFLVEFGKDIAVYMLKKDMTYMVKSVEEILPYSFNL